MSRKQKIKHMSSDELKAKLYSHFQKSGSLDHLRTQLRGQLVSELFKIAEPVDPDKFPNICDVEKCLLPLQVCNWLVYDHLSRQNYQYSLSTFVTEAQLPYPEKFLTAGDVLGLLGLKNTTDSENISILYSNNNELGFLHSLLLAIIKTMFNVSNKDLAPGACHQNAVATNSKKIMLNDQKESAQSFVQNKSVIDNTSVQDLPQFKQINTNKSFLTNDDDRSAEMSYLEQFQSFKEENEKEMQKMRHRLLEELDTLHSEKRKMQIDLERTKSELRKEESKLLKEKERLKEKEVILEKELENQFEIKMRTMQSEFAEKLHFKEKDIESLKRKLSEKDDKLAYLENKLVNENSLKEQELKDYKDRTKTLQDKYASALDENTNLHRKFENMSDYTVLKEEVSIKSREVTRLQSEIKDFYQKSEAERRKYVETVRNLENNLDMKESQLIQAKEEIDDMRNTLKKERALWNKERKKIEHDLRELKNSYETLIQRLEEKNEEIEELHQTIHILNYKLTNNVISTAKSDSVGLYKNYERPVINQKIDSGILFTKRNLPFQQQSEKDYDSKFKFFSDKKNSFGALKKEENAVQEKYSIIFSTMPQHNNQISYPRNYNFLSLPKKITESYNSFSKPASVNSAFNYENNVSGVTKTPYSLSDVKKMVTHSLFPYKTSKQVDFLPDVSNFATSSKSNYHHSFHKQYSSTETDDNPLILNVIKDRSLSSKDNNTSKNSLRLSSRDENVGESHEKVLSLKEQIEEVTISNESRHTLHESNEKAGNSRKDSLKNNMNEASSDIDKNIVFTSLQNSEAISERTNINKQNCEISSQDQFILIDSSQQLHNTQKINEKAAEPKVSVFVNLDDAWKKKSSVTYLPSPEGIMSETNSKDVPDSSLPTNDRTAFSAKEHAFDSSLQKQIKIGSKNVIGESNEDMHNKSAENVDKKSEDSNSENTPYLKQNKKNGDSLNLEHETSLCDKSVRIANVDTIKFNMTNASGELQIPHKKTEISVDIAKEGNEKEGNYEEQENAKSEKSGNNDSLSEQSELHLSCGSEAEQQKEDSDAW